MTVGLRLTLSLPIRGHRLQAIATPLVPNMEKVQIIPPPKEVDPRVLAWKGAAVLGKMEGVADLWVTGADWVSAWHCRRFHPGPCPLLPPPESLLLPVMFLSFAVSSVLCPARCAFEPCGRLFPAPDPAFSSQWRVSCKRHPFCALMLLHMPYEPHYFHCPTLYPSGPHDVSGGLCGILASSLNDRCTSTHAPGAASFLHLRSCLRALWFTRVLMLPTASPRRRSLGYVPSNNAAFTFEPAALGQGR